MLQLSISMTVFSTAAALFMQPLILHLYMQAIDPDTELELAVSSLVGAVFGVLVVLCRRDRHVLAVADHHPYRCTAACLAWRLGQHTGRPRPWQHWSTVPHAGSLPQNPVWGKKCATIGSVAGACLVVVAIVYGLTVESHLFERPAKVWLCAMALLPVGMAFGYLVSRYVTKLSVQQQRTVAFVRQHASNPMMPCAMHGFRSR